MAEEVQLDFVGDLPGPESVPVIRPCSDSIRYDITPRTKPRQTRADKWKERPCVVAYRDYADRVRELGITLSPTGDRVIFVLPMPKSWSKKKRDAMRGMPHQQTPDLDNLAKALQDAIFSKRGNSGSDDSHIFHIEPLKFWGDAGAIIIQKAKQAERLEGDTVIWRE